MKTAALLPTEHQTQNAIIGYLRMRGYYVERLNSGQYGLGEGRSRRYVRGVAAGTPDLMAFRQVNVVRGENITVLKHTPYTTLLFIEVKKSPKHKPTPLQLAKMQELEEYGARCIVASSIEDLQSAGI